MKKFLKATRRLISLLISICILFQWYAFFPVKAAEAASKPSFVTRQGDKLMLNGSVFRFLGANAWDMSQSRTKYNGGIPNLNPSPYELNDRLKTFNEMGINVIRFFPVCMNASGTLEPSLNTWDEKAWEQLDYVIKTAGEYNIRLIFPLVDGNNYAGCNTSGTAVFTQWRGIQNADEFFTNETVINDFKQFISHLLNRINTYTGIAYKDDPTIMALETGNEVKPPVSWTKDIAAYIKSIDLNHLVMDGSYGLSKQIMDDPNVDIVSNHYYYNNDYAARPSSLFALIIVGASGTLLAGTASPLNL